MCEQNQEHQDETTETQTQTPTPPPPSEETKVDTTGVKLIDAFFGPSK